MKTLYTLAVAGLLLAAPAYAENNEDLRTGHKAPQSQDDHGEHDSHDHAHDDMDHSGAVDIYAPAMETMHSGMMAVEPTGDADVDFVRGMIPHRQGAVDMAKILKEKGKDPELRSLADQIIGSQEKEIAFMKDWLERHGKAEQ